MKRRLFLAALGALIAGPQRALAGLFDRRVTFGCGCVVVYARGLPPQTVARCKTCERLLLPIELELVFEPLLVSDADARFLSSVQVSREDVARLFGVPAKIIGDRTWDA